MLAHPVFGGVVSSAPKGHAETARGCALVVHHRLCSGPVGSAYGDHWDVKRAPPHGRLDRIFSRVLLGRPRVAAPPAHNDRQATTPLGLPASPYQQCRDRAPASG